MRYVKKPILPIQAWQIAEWWFDGYDKLIDIIPHFNENVTLDYEDRLIVIHTKEGDMKGNIGDYLICGVFGEFYSCKEDIFESTYEQCLE